MSSRTRLVDGSAASAAARSGLVSFRRTQNEPRRRKRKNRDIIFRLLHNARRRPVAEAAENRETALYINSWHAQILLVAIGGAAWALLGWLVVRAWPLRAAARRL